MYLKPINKDREAERRLNAYTHVLRGGVIVDGWTPVRPPVLHPHASRRNVRDTSRDVARANRDEKRNRRIARGVS